MTTHRAPSSGWVPRTPHRAKKNSIPKILFILSQAAFLLLTILVTVSAAMATPDAITGERQSAPLTFVAMLAVWAVWDMIILGGYWIVKTIARNEAEKAQRRKDDESRV